MFSPNVHPQTTVDAAYEHMQKRTFLAMALVIAATLPVLLGLIVLYRKLQPRRNDTEQKTTDSSERDASGSGYMSDEEKEERESLNFELKSLMVANSK